MSVWTKRIALYLDVESAGGAPLLAGKSSQRLTAWPVFIQGDKVRLELYFRTPASSPLNASTVAELAAGSKIVVAAKQAEELDEASSLFSVTGFAQAGAGDDLCYYADLDLNTQEIDDLFSEASDSSAAIKVDVEVQNADNSDRLTFQFDATLKQQVYDNEPPTTPGTPPHYSAAECEARFVPRSEDEAWKRRYDNGDGPRDWHYDPTTQKWYPEVLVTINGVRVVALGEDGIVL